MGFQRNISLLLGNGGSSVCGVHCVELADGVEFAALVEKVMTGPMEKAIMDLARAVTAPVERWLSVRWRRP
jgi:hypothetical protein